MRQIIRCLGKQRFVLLFQVYLHVVVVVIVVNFVFFVPVCLFSSIELKVVQAL